MRCFSSNALVSALEEDIAIAVSDSHAAFTCVSIERASKTELESRFQMQ